MSVGPGIRFLGRESLKILNTQIASLISKLWNFPMCLKETQNVLKWVSAIQSDRCSLKWFNGLQTIPNVSQNILKILKVLRFFLSCINVSQSFSKCAKTVSNTVWMSPCIPIISAFLVYVLHISSDWLPFNIISFSKYC